MRTRLVMEQQTLDRVKKESPKYVHGLIQGDPCEAFGKNPKPMYTNLSISPENRERLEKRAQKALDSNLNSPLSETVTEFN